MRTRLMPLPLLALVVAALACSVLGSPTATPPPQPSPASPTSAGPTPPAEATTTPVGATATKPAAEGVNLSGTSKAETPRLGFDAQGILHLVWFDKSAREAGDYFHRQKPADGVWSKAESLTTDFDIVYGDVSLIRDQDGHLCVLFAAAKTSSSPETIGLYQRCQGGATWSPAVKLTITHQTGISLRGYSPARGADGMIHAAYIVGAGTVYFDDVQLSTDSTALEPSFAIDKAGGYHVAWVSLGAASSPATVQYRFSSDQGKTWKDVQILSTDPSAPGGGLARLVADDAGNVHVSWTDGDIYYRRWTPTGGWGAPAALAGDQRGPNPALAADAQGLARVVWERSDGLRYVVQAADGTWSAPRTLSQQDSGAPQIAIDATGAAHIAWLANKDVYYLAAP